MKKEGFTLVELLAVIVILVIILAIAVPIISSLIENARKGSFESDAKMILKQLDYEKLKNESFDITTVNESTISDFGLSSENYQKLRVEVINDIPYIVVVGKGKWNGYRACGTYYNITVTPNSDTTTCVVISDYYDETKGVNKPILAAGMTPTKWNGTAWVDTIETDADWYSYTSTDKKWANARTADGSMWVWIPRYIYKISSGWHTSTVGTINIQFTKYINDDWNSSVIGNINTGTTATSSNNIWTNHPAFTFGTTQLTGIWVSKFEASGTTSAINIVPNVSSLRTLKINDMFVSSRNMETNSRYGWGTTGSGIDTHMIKNTEWGSAVYLAQSIYGKNAEIWINVSATHITGCAGSSASAGTSSSCYAYNTSNGQQASTTGNITGIYDMKGGAWEYTAAYVNNGSTNLSIYGNSILNADNKYKDVYSVTINDQANNYANAIDKKGDAVYEISSTYSGSTAWYSDYSSMPYSSTPWFGRSGDDDSVSGAGTYTFTYFDGIASGDISFRPILLVGEGL